MRTLLTVVTIVAVLCGLLPFLGIAILATLVGVLTLLVVPVCLGTLALYCCGNRQTFFLGAVIGSLAPHVLGPVYPRDVMQLVAMALVTIASAATCGLVAVSTRRFLERRGWHRVPDGDELDR